MLRNYLLGKRVKIKCNIISKLINYVCLNECNQNLNEINFNFSFSYFFNQIMCVLKLLLIILLKHNKFVIHFMVFLADEKSKRDLVLFIL